MFFFKPKKKQTEEDVQISACCEIDETIQEHCKKKKKNQILQGSTLHQSLLWSEFQEMYCD